MAAVETQVDSLRARERHEAQERGATPAVADLHFLVVEDQRVQRMLLVGVLEALGAKMVLR